MEEIDRLQQLGYQTKRPVSRQGHAIRVPTDRFALRIQFPRGYPIAEFSPKATVTFRNGAGKSQLSAAEADRVQSSFRVRHNRLELEIEQPRLDHAYYFEWRPPSDHNLPRDLDLGLGLPE